jgi:type II restriction enzyme
MDVHRLRDTIDLSHSQVQTLIAGIGHIKGYDVYIPGYDVGKLDSSLTNRFPLRSDLPSGFEQVGPILSEIDVLWIAAGQNAVEGLYEIEHSTPVYSGLLRFNDVLLTDPKVLRFSIVSNDARRDLFSRQLFRPTFRKSGLAELCSFLEYTNVYDWHKRLIKGDTYGAEID